MSLPEKERLLSMLTEIYDELEELELVLEASFSDLRHSLNRDEFNKLSSAEIKLSMLEKDLDKLNMNSSEIQEKQPGQIKPALKLEMGF